MVHYHVAAREAEQVAEEVRALGAEARTLAGDIADVRATAALAETAGSWKGRLDGLVTSAGVYLGPLVDEVRPSDWEEVIRKDLEGTFWTVQAALPWLRRSDRASVVTLSSVFGSHPAVGGAPYQIAKAGVEQMTRTLALELAPAIRVNCVAPGFIRTDMNRAGHEDPEFGPKVARLTPLGRWGEPEDVAPAVRYLLSRDADWVTGIVLGVDGGIALR